MQPIFTNPENQVVLGPFANRNSRLEGPKRGPSISSKRREIQYFNLFGGPLFETTTESSKIVGPGTCQTRAILCIVKVNLLRNIFCSDLSLIRCEHDYVTNCDIIMLTAN